MKRMTLLPLYAAVLAALIAFPGCTAPKPVGPAKIQTELVRTGRIVKEQELSGVLVPSRSLNIFAKLAGQAKVVSVEIGDRVAEDQLLVQIDTKELNAQLAVAEAAGATVRDQAALQLTYTRVTAPLSGVISKVNVDPGQYLQAGQSLLAIVPLDDVHVVANLKETELEHVRAGDAVKIEVDAYPGKPVQGVVESFSPATGAKFSLLPPDNATGNYTHVVQHLPVRIRVTDAPNAERPLRPGMSVQVTITTRNR